VPITLTIHQHFQRTLNTLPFGMTSLVNQLFLQTLSYFLHCFISCRPTSLVDSETLCILYSSSRIGNAVFLYISRERRDILFPVLISRKEKCLDGHLFLRPRFPVTNDTVVLPCNNNLLTYIHVKFMLRLACVDHNRSVSTNFIKSFNPKTCLLGFGQRGRYDDDWSRVSLCVRS
jgi:hypothetical protein